MFLNRRLFNLPEFFNWTGPMLNNVREESRAEKKGAQDHLTTGIWL